MNDMTIGLDRTEENVLNCKISDEALEIVAGPGSEKLGYYTLYFCTALDLCPGP